MNDGGIVVMYGFMFMLLAGIIIMLLAAIGELRRRIVDLETVAAVLLKRSASALIESTEPGA